jgi:PAS domain S-box-containing protein
MTEVQAILVIDDDGRMCDSLKTLLNKRGYAVRTCDNGNDAVALLGDHAFDIVLLDICMEGMDGFEVMEKTAGLRKDTKFILMSGYHSKELAVQAFKSGASYYLRKPFDPDEVLEVIATILSYKKEMDRLRISEKRYRRLAENSRDMIYRMSLPGGQYEYVNSASRDIMGYSPEEFYNEPLIIRKIIHPEWMGYFEKQWAALLSGKLPDFYEYQIVHKLGETRWLHQRNRMLRDESGTPIAIEGVVTDITERKRYETMLEESEAKFRGLFDLSPIPISVSELKTGRFIEVNAELCRFTKYSKEELVGKGSTEVGLFSSSDRDRFIKALGPSGEVKGLEMDFRTKDGVFRSTLMFSKIFEGGDGRYILSTFYDQTDRKNLEVQNQVVQRLEAVATLSGGIAHQFNNALQNVVGNIELLEMALPDNEIVEEFGRTATESTQRMAHLVNQLLAYARGGKYSSKIIRLNDFVKNMLPAVAENLDVGIVIETNLSEMISDIHADASQLKMVLDAVLVNAVEAIEGTGRIVISTESEEVDAAYAAAHPGLRSGSYVCLKVKDDGKGMDEKTAGKIFEPFFTTKSSGRGLGMSAVYGIVKNHGGYTYVNSKPGKGTTVCILLPLVKLRH